MLTRSPVSVTSWYTWSVDGSPIQVRIPLLLIHELRRRLDKPLESEDSYASEAGLLIGRSPRPGISQITGFHPVSRLDPHTVLEAVTRNPGTYIGLYRTTPAGSLLMTADDLLLAEAYFHQESSVVLLIESGPVGPEEAAFFVWRKGRIDGPPLRPFPFDEYQLAGLERPSISELPDPRVPDSTPVEPPARTRKPKSVERDAKQEVAKEPQVARLGWPADRVRLMANLLAPEIVRRAVWVVAAMLLAGIGLFFATNRHRSGAPVRDRKTAASTPAVVASSAALGLTAERSGKGLLLSWDSQAPAILSATSGTLLIQAGANHQDIALTREQLQSGSFVYTPTMERLTIRLRVLGSDNSVRDDSMTVFLPRQTDLRPVVVPQEKDHSTSASADAVRSTIAERTKRFTNPTQAEPAKTAPTRLDEAPAVALPIPRGSPTDSISLPAAIPGPVSTDPKTDAISGAGVAGDRETSPSSPKPAVAIYQSIPKFPSELRFVLHEPTSVQVAVTIDRSGKVVKAEAVAEKGVHVLLRQAAVEAARNWRFQPALVNGQAVQSQAVLKFDFKPRN